jgi:hypothetical protein
MIPSQVHDVASPQFAPMAHGRRIVTRAKFAIALAVLLIASPAASFDLGRPLDRGGEIGVYLARIVAQAGQPYEIAGDCMSACTMWLGHRGACVTPDAVLWFHAAWDPLQAMRNGNPWRTMSDRGNATLLSMYPPRVRERVRPWLETPEFHTLSGAELAALGVPLCRTRAARNGG